MRIFDIDWRGSPEFVDLFFQFNIRQLISKGIYENLFTEKEKTKIFLIIKKIVDNIESEHKLKDFGDILLHMQVLFGAAQRYRQGGGAGAGDEGGEQRFAGALEEAQRRNTGE